MTAKAQLLLGFALVIISTVAFPALPKFFGCLIIIGAVLSWYRLAQVIRSKPYPAWKQKGIQALIAGVAMSIALTPLPIPAKLKLSLIVLATGIGWFSLIFKQR
jgi:hypothetical protein